MEMTPDTLEAVGINELFVAVGVDLSFTTEQVLGVVSIAGYMQYNARPGSV